MVLKIRKYGDKVLRETSTPVEKIDEEILKILDDMVDTMKVESKDYLQVFELSEYDGMQKIVHSQEMPEYKMEYLIKLQGAPIFVGKIYVIDDKTHSTMLKAEEY